MLTVENDALWSFGKAATSHAALAGVLAGVAFTALVLFMQRTDPDATTSPAYEFGLRHLIEAFFGLVISAFFFGIASGLASGIVMQTIVAIPSTVVFAISVIELTVAMVWMTRMFANIAESTARKAALALTVMASVFVADTIGDLGALIGEPLVDRWSALFGLVVGTALALPVVFRDHQPARQIAESDRLSFEASQQVGAALGRREKASNRTARVIAGCASALSVAAFSAFFAPDDRSPFFQSGQLAGWRRSIVVALGVVEMAVLAVALWCLMRALPRPEPEFVAFTSQTLEPVIACATDDLSSAKI
jgi:hypothetical protein